jgi:hypothetical protein
MMKNIIKTMFVAVYCSSVFASADSELNWSSLSTKFLGGELHIQLNYEETRIDSFDITINGKKLGIDQKHLELKGVPNLNTLKVYRGCSLKLRQCYYTVEFLSVEFDNDSDQFGTSLRNKFIFSNDCFLRKEVIE